MSDFINFNAIFEEIYIYITTICFDLGDAIYNLRDAVVDIRDDRVIGCSTHAYFRFNGSVMEIWYYCVDKSFYLNNESNTD